MKVSNVLLNFLKSLWLSLVGLSTIFSVSFLLNRSPNQCHLKKDVLVEKFFNNLHAIFYKVLKKSLSGSEFEV